MLASWLPTADLGRRASRWQTYRWDFRWELDVFGYICLALLDGTVHVDGLNLLAQVCGGAEQFDQAVLDLDDYICSLCDVFFECADGFDGEGLSTATESVSSLLQCERRGAYGRGGFGDRLTCSIVNRSEAKSGVQCSSGEMPGIFFLLSSPSRGDCSSPLQIDKASTTTALKRSGVMTASNFIASVISYDVVKSR